MLAVHLTILACTAIVIFFSDHLGWQYFRGIKETLDPALVYRLHYAVWAGLFGMIATGLYMAWPDLSDYAGQVFFWGKMFFVGILVINSIAITFLIGVATQIPYASLTLKQKAPLLISGALSTIGWAGAALMGLLYFG